MGTVRSTYLIDEDGKIEKAFGKVKAADNPAQMLDELKVSDHFTCEEDECGHGQLFVRTAAGFPGGDRGPERLDQESVL